MVCETADMPMPKIKVVEMNAAGDLGYYDKRQSPDGRTYYWAAGNGMSFAHTATGSDVEALKQGHVTITPLSYVLTDDARLIEWKAMLDV